MPTEPSSADSKSPLTKDVVLVRSAALWGILFLLILYTLYFTAAISVPITLAFLLNLVLAPAVRILVRMHLPQSLAAMLVMVSFTVLLVAGLYNLASPASEWMQRAPGELRSLEQKLSWIKEPFNALKEAEDQMRDIADVPEEIRVSQGPSFTFSLITGVLRRTPDLLYGIAVTQILLFFLLASGDSFLNKMVHLASTMREKKRIVETARNIERNVSAYLGTITVINFFLAVVTAITMYILDMPNPILWGVMVGVLNYIPYLGVAFSILVVGFVSFLTFDSLGAIIAPPLAIFIMNVIEGQILTPILTGRRLSLSPVAVFLSLVILGWIWGVFGVLIAVPLLAAVKLVCESVEPLVPISVFLGRPE